MACRFPYRIAAFAPVAGLRAGTPQEVNGKWVPDRSTCRPARPVPVIAFHGTSDTTNPFQGSDDPRWGYSVPAALARWATIDHCGRARTTSPVTSIVDRISYPRCPDGTDVVLLREQGAEHIWPGSSPGEVDPARTMWAFFKRHPLSR
jgi:polyhydroxybutyrate depolymerase